jgi:hypothetical protein
MPSTRIEDMGSIGGGGWLVHDQATAHQQSLPSFNEPDIYCGIIGVVTVETSKVILEEAENLSYGGRRYR